MIEIWYRPWARLGIEGRDYDFLRPDRPELARGHAESIRLCTAAVGGPVVNGKRGDSKEIQRLADGRCVFTMPIPIRMADGMVVSTERGDVRLVFEGIPDRPSSLEQLDLATPTDRKREAIVLLNRIKAVWARLRDVESAIADPATIWERLTELWLTEDRAAAPEMDIIVQQARSLLPPLEQLDRAPRRVLRRVQKMIPLSRVQEVDRRTMTWLVRQPGETMAERAGDRQRINAIAREENFDTLENRVVRSYAQLAGSVAREYLEHYPRGAVSKRLIRVEKFGKRCRQLADDFKTRGVGTATPEATPNFVLQNNVNSRKVWNAWFELRKRERILDDLWRWQARSWEEFCALALVVALQSIAGARLIATSPLEFREEQEQGCWLRHVNPLAVFFLPNQGVTVEVTYRSPVRPILGRFGAPIWLRFGRIGDNTFLERWAVWPIWHAIGGLDEDDLTRIPPLLSAGKDEQVRGGITIRPTVPEGDALGASCDKAACVTIGASGRALAAGIGRLRDFLTGTIFRGTS